MKFFRCLFLALVASIVLPLHAASPDAEIVKYLFAKYKGQRDRAELVQVVSLSRHMEYPDFPTRHDILGLIETESDYRSDVLVQHNYGLMQVRCLHITDPTLDCDAMLKNVKTNMLYGVYVLREYYVQLGRDKVAAIQAYNTGIGAYLRGARSSVYLNRVMTRSAKYAAMSAPGK